MSNHELQLTSKRETEVSAIDLVRQVREIVLAAEGLEVHGKSAVGNALYDAAIKLVNQDN